MNHDYKLRFDQVKENTASQSESIVQNEESDFYQGEGSIRNFVLEWKDGNRRGFPYPYIVDYDFKISDTKNVIILEFPSKIVSLYGYGLGPLFWAFIKQTVRVVQEVDERYADQKETVVTGFDIVQKNNS